MTPRRRRAVAARLLLLIAVVGVLVWLLYRNWLHLPAAPPPPVTPSGLVAPFLSRG